MNVNQYLAVALIYISVLTNDIKYLFHVLAATHESSKHVFISSAHFLTELFVFFLFT